MSASERCQIQIQIQSDDPLCKPLSNEQRSEIDRHMQTRIEKCCNQVSFYFDSNQEAGGFHLASEARKQRSKW